MRSITRLAIAVLIGLVLGSVLLGSLATENAFHIYKHPTAWTEAARAVARRTSSEWEPASVTAADGAILRAWLFTPAGYDGSAVILLHGIADTRQGMIGHAPYLLKSGFAVLIPDSRAHGESGGAITTYGIKEAADVRRWSDWLIEKRAVKRLYGLGVSLGGAILLESLPYEPRFRAIVADSPFASFQEIAYDRLSETSGIARPALWPVVESGFLYARFRYGLDMRRASPAAAVRTTSIPILLIHGTRDSKTPPRHSRELRALNPGATRLWEVPGAEHAGALGAQPMVYGRTVVEWFHSHP